MSGSKKRKRRRKRIQAIISIFVVLLVGVIATVLVMLYLKKESNPTGIWVRSVDMTEEIAANAALWLSDIDGYEPNISELSSESDRIVLNVVLEMERTNANEGNYKQTLDMQSYEDSRQRAERIYTGCLEELVAKKLQSMNYAETVTPDQVKDMEEAILGMKLEDYLKENGVEMFPSYEELSKDFQEEGTFVMKKGLFVRQCGMEEKTEPFIKKGDLFILPDTQNVYRKQVEE